MRSPAAVMALVATIAIAGCSRAPEAPRAPASKPAAATGHEEDHDHDHGHVHGHAVTSRDHDDHDHDHDHGDHDHPRTLSEAAGRLAAVAASVKKHLAAGAREDADAAVHDMGHLLEDLHELVRTSGLAAAAKAAATKAADELFECFNEIDDSLHAEPGDGKPPAEVHATVAERIEAAIGAFEAAVGGKAAAVEDEAAAIVREAEASRRKEQE